MHVDREPLDPAMRDKARRVLDTMCRLDGTSFAALRDELEWTDKELQACLRYLNGQGYVVGRVLPSLMMRYCVTELGWSACELLAELDRGEEP
jgi:DNA-binding HxlR family transcriptional regulator